MPRHVTSCHVMYLVSRHGTSSHVISRNVTSCHILPRHVTSCHIICYVISRPKSRDGHATNTSLSTDFFHTQSIRIKHDRVCWLSRRLPIQYRISGIWSSFSYIILRISFFSAFFLIGKKTLMLSPCPSVCLSVCKPIFSRTIRHTEPIFSSSLHLYFPWNLSKFGSFLTTKFGITW